MLTSTGGHGDVDKLKTPAFSNTDQTVSDWTNSVAADNGGTEISIVNIAETGDGTGTYTITADVIVKKWGTEHVKMNLDLDTIVDTSV